MHKWLIPPYPNPWTNPPPPPPFLQLLSPPLPLCQIKKHRASVELRAVCECKRDSAILWGACAIHLLTHSFTHPHTLIHTFIHATINSYCSLLSTASASASASASTSASQRAVIKTTLVIRPRSPLSLSLSVSVLLSASLTLSLTLTLTPTLTPTLPLPLVLTGLGIGFWFGSCRIRATPYSSRIYGRWLRLTKLSKLSSQSPIPFRSSASTFTLLRNAGTFTIQDYQIFMPYYFFHISYRVAKVLAVKFFFNKWNSFITCGCIIPDYSFIKGRIDSIDCH